MGIHYYTEDIPSNITITGDIAIDTEAMGLDNLRDRLCVVQIADDSGDAYIVHFPKKQYNCPNLKKLLNDPSRLKIFHFARFDVAIIKHYLGINFTNIYCTKIASRLCRTYTDMHGLKDLCNDLLKVKISKQQQSSDWGAEKLTQEQMQYAANDVLHLHKLKTALDKLLEREGRIDLAKKCFEFLPTRAELDLAGWLNTDIFIH